MRSIELFSGAGGLALGIHLAGFHHQLLVESDPHAFETLRANRDGGTVAGVSDWPLVHAKVEDVDLTGFTGIDLLAGGIPCQPFSNGGKRRGIDDHRNMFPIFASALATVRPKAFLLENVNGLVHGRLVDTSAYLQLQLAYPWHVAKADQSWRDHWEELRCVDGVPMCSESSYAVTCSILNAADYGVPQIRKRVFIVGFRRDLHVQWEFPTPTHSNKAPPSYQSVEPGAGEYLPWRVVADAIADLPTLGTQEAQSLQHLKIAGAKSYRGHTGSELRKPAKPLKAGVHGVGGGENMLREGPSQVRYFTIRECARLQTFPDAWVLRGGWSNVTRQLGNALPVELAKAVALSIRRVL